MRHHTSSSVPTLPSYINGRFIELSRPETTLTCANPCAPEDILGVVGWSRELVPNIIDGLKTAHHQWAELRLEERLVVVQRFISCLRENSDELKSQMMLELGRCRVSVEEEWRACEALFSILPDFCTEAIIESTSKRGWRCGLAPVGLVLLSSTVALPVYSILSTLLPTLVAGNATAVRPSKHAVLSASILISSLHQAGFPPGLIQWIYGDFAVYRQLILTHEFNVVLYGGSEESREQLRKDLFAYPDTRMVLRTAGKNAALVLETAEVTHAVDRVLYGVCADAGQRFEATGLAFVHRSVASQFVDAMVEAVKALPTGVRLNLEDPKSHIMGPLCSNEARERFLRFQGIAYRESKETLRWGKSIDNPGGGFYVSPGVHLIEPTAVLRSVYAKSAIFGPDICIVPIDTAAEAVEIYDRLDSGDILSVHASSDEEVQEVRRLAEVPRVFWGCPTTWIEPDFPSGTKGNPAGGSMGGLDFLKSVVFPKVFRIAKDMGPTLFGILITIAALTFLSAATPASANYRKAVEGNDVVKGKLYPRQGRFQLNLLQGGSLLNQAFIDTYLVTASATYHINEWHAIGIEGFFGISQDRDERTCVESFFFDEDRSAAYGADTWSDDTSPYTGEKNTGYDPKFTDQQEVKPPKIEEESWETSKAKGGPFLRKPGYMAIRQVDQLYGINYQWTPVYGKALWFLSYVGYLDVYGVGGLGVAQTTFWPQKNWVEPRDACNGNYLTKECGTDDASAIGIEGRPDPVSDMPIVASGGLGSRFYVGRVANGNSPPSMMFLANMELRNFTLVSMSTEQTFMNVLGIWGGLGILF